MCSRIALRLLVGALALSGASRVTADVIRSETVLCPPGLRPYVGHGGGCQPYPPDDCPAGYVPRVWHHVAYCEPPPAAPCPPGSEPVSAGPDRLYCGLTRYCSPEWPCEPGSTCRSTSLCVDPEHLPRLDPRFALYRAYSECAADADCEPGQLCDTSWRCDPDIDRADPQGRTLPVILRPTPSASAIASSPCTWLTTCCCAVLVFFAVFLPRLRARAGGSPAAQSEPADDR